MQFPESIEQADRKLYLIINSEWSNNFFDIVMPFLRTKENWIPLYVMLAIWLVYRYKLNGLIIIVFMALTVTLSDQLSSFVLKPFFERPRPCNVPELAEQANLLIGCSGSFSFTSSHATNHFALATVFGLLFFKKYKWIFAIALFWAASISFAQVYVGVHYPLDVIAGAITGSIVGFILYLFAAQVLKRKGW